MTIDEIYNAVKAAKAAYYNKDKENYTKLSKELRELGYNFINFELDKLETKVV